MERRRAAPSHPRLARSAKPTEEASDETETGSRGGSGGDGDADWRHGDLAESGAREDGWNNAPERQGDPDFATARAAARRPKWKREGARQSRDHRGEGHARRRRGVH